MPEMAVSIKQAHVLGEDQQSQLPSWPEMLVASCPRQTGAVTCILGYSPANPASPHQGLCGCAPVEGTPLFSMLFDSAGNQGLNVQPGDTGICLHAIP